MNPAGRNQPSARPRRLVVGVHDSPASRTALGWALRQASLLRCSVDVVTAWGPGALAATVPPAAAAGGWVGYPTSVPEPEIAKGLADEAERAAQDAVSAATMRAGTAVDVRTWSVQGDPVEVLTEAADPGDLLVIGRGRRPMWLAALTGSVTTRLLAHARCPVVVATEGSPVP